MIHHDPSQPTYNHPITSRQIGEYDLPRCTLATASRRALLQLITHHIYPFPPSCISIMFHCFVPNSAPSPSTIHRYAVVLYPFPSVVLVYPSLDTSLLPLPIGVLFVLVHACACLARCIAFIAPFVGPLVAELAALLTHIFAHIIYTVPMPRIVTQCK